MRTRAGLAHLPRRVKAAVAVATVLVVMAVGLGVYGILTGAPTANDGERHRTPATAALTPAVSQSAGLAPTAPVIEPADDPETFARTIAMALFTWDTTSGLDVLDYTSVLLDVGDPSGHEQAGLAADIATYLPTSQAWSELRNYQTRQYLEIERAFVPEQWQDVRAQAREGQLPAGAIAYTVEGTRHRGGTWNGQPVSSRHRVVFTVFMVCEPAYPQCRLLRLSELNNPLR